MCSCVGHGTKGPLTLCFGHIDSSMAITCTKLALTTWSMVFRVVALVEPLGANNRESGVTSLARGVE